MRIAALVPEAIVNAVYRSYVPMQALAQRGHTVQFQERDVVDDVAPLLECDVVHIVRICQEPMARIAQRLKDAGVVVVWDNDDNLWAVPKGNPNYKMRSGLQGQRVLAAMTKMMAVADIVTTPSAMLAELYRRAAGANAQVVENYLPSTFVGPRRGVGHEGVLVGWVAGAEHQRDVEQLRLRAVLEGLLERHADVRVASIGVNLGIRSDRYFHVGSAPYAELPNYLAEFDIGIAPLTDIPFNQGRSNVKTKEYAAVGVPWLASPIGPYAGMGEAQGGRLVADDSWDEQLDQLVSSAGTRKKLAKAATRWARTQTIEHHVERYEELLENAVARAGR
jgi:glycosyltransferase involved in cell wall biosynthesis